MTKRKVFKSRWLAWGIAFLVLLALVVKVTPAKRYVEFYAARIFFDNSPYTLIASCDKFIETRQQADQIKRMIRTALYKDPVIGRLIRANQVFIEVIDPVVVEGRPNCNRKYAIEIAYNSHKVGVRIRKLLKKEGLLKKYAINLSNL